MKPSPPDTRANQSSASPGHDEAAGRPGSAPSGQLATAISPAIGPLPAIYIAPPGQPGPAGLAWDAAVLLLRHFTRHQEAPMSEQSIAPDPQSVRHAQVALGAPARAGGEKAGA